MIRVCHLVRQYHPNVGGLENFVSGLTKALTAHGCTNTIITLDRLFTEPGHKLAPRECVDGIDIHRIPFVGHRRFFAVQLPAEQLAAADVVHVHGFDGLYEAVARAPRVGAQVRLATSHGLFFHTPWMKTAKQVYLATITKFAARGYDALIANSLSDARHMASLGRPVEHIPNGVEPLGVQLARGRDLLTLGRLASHKHVDWLIDMLAQECLSNVRLHIVGADWDVKSGALAARARALGVDDRIVFHGRLDKGPLQRVVADCGVFVSASTYEGFGMSLIEAMSVGLVPVVHPNPSFMELMAAAPAGQTAHFDDPAHAARSVRRALDTLSSNKQRDLAAYARRFGWEAHGERTVALYHHLLADRGGLRSYKRCAGRD